MALCEKKWQFGAIIDSLVDHFLFNWFKICRNLKISRILYRICAQIETKSKIYPKMSWSQISYRAKKQAHRPTVFMAFFIKVFLSAPIKTTLKKLVLIWRVKCFKVTFNLTIKSTNVFIPTDSMFHTCRNKTDD